MTLHLHMNYACPECEALYIPYGDDIPCPKCGHVNELEEYPDLIGGICESFLFNIKDVGDFMPMCWATMDISDTIQLLFFSIFNKWVTEEMLEHEPITREKEFGRFLHEIMDEADLGDHSYVRDYLIELDLKVYHEFFEIREIGLKVNNGKILIDG